MIKQFTSDQGILDYNLGHGFERIKYRYIFDKESYDRVNFIELNIEDEININLFGLKFFKINSHPPLKEIKLEKYIEGCFIFKYNIPNIRFVSGRIMKGKAFGASLYINKDLLTTCEIKENNSNNIIPFFDYISNSVPFDLIDNVSIQLLLFSHTIEIPTIQIDYKDFDEENKDDEIYLTNDYYKNTLEKTYELIYQKNNIMNRLVIQSHNYFIYCQGDGWRGLYKYNLDQYYKKTGMIKPSKDNLFLTKYSRLIPKYIFEAFMNKFSFTLYYTSDFI